VTRYAEISDAGIAGLTAAAALAQRGWSVRVHEQSPDLREIGAGLFVWPNGVEALRDIGALESAIAGGSALRTWSIFDDRQRQLQGGVLDGAYCVARRELHGSLANAALAAGVDVQLNSTVISATGTGAITLADGEELKADLVIVADGINSRVRETLGVTATRYDLRYGAQRLFVQGASSDPVDYNPEYWNGSWRVGIAPTGPGRLYLYMFCPPGDRVGCARPLDHAAWMRAFPAIADALSRLPNETDWRAINELQCDRWSVGRAVLLGDAAHAMAPNWGQGANSTMRSAVLLADSLTKTDDVAAAAAAWETDHRTIIDQIQRYSRYYSNAMTRWPKRLTDLRSALVWTFGHSHTLQRRVTGLR
jgi:2-polyprenyl-6-methoxyphenol hydroxylase-like FAD-dependent oxidoreductase